MTRSIGILVAVAALASGAPTRLEAQTYITISSGPAEYDLSGTGWSSTVGAHVERVVRPWLRTEGGIGSFWYESQSDESTLMLIPEIGLAFQAPRPFPVYLGLGVGHTLVLNGPETAEPTLHGALGFQWAPNEACLVRPEMRVRIVDPWVGTIAGFTLGVAMRVGG